jgi:hypothetical protein
VVWGIPIALTGEQVIEALHWSEAVREAKASIHSELAAASVFGEERRARPRPTCSRGRA